MSSHRTKATKEGNSKKLVSKTEEKEDIGFFVSNDYTNFIKSRFKTEESICSVFALKEKVLVGSTVGRVYFFNKNEEDIGGEGSFNTNPILGFAKDLRGNILVIQENNVHIIDPRDARIEFNYIQLLDEQIINTTFDPSNPTQYCCIMKNMKNKRIDLKITLIKPGTDKPVFVFDQLSRTYINHMSWIGDTIVIIMSNRGNDGMFRDIIVYFFDLTTKTHTQIPFNNMEIKLSASCCLSALNKEIVVLTWGNLRGEFRAYPSYESKQAKKFAAPTAFFLPSGVNEVYSLGLLGDKMVGFVNCKDQGAKYGLKVLASNDERDKKATFSLMPKEDISEYFELFTDKTGEDEYLWLLTERKFMKIKMLRDRDIIDIWKEQKRYDLVLDRVLKRNMDMDKDELIEDWEQLILSVMDGTLTVKDEPYILMEDFLEYDIMELEDYLEIAQDFVMESKRFRERDSREAREYEKLKTQKKESLIKVLLFYTNYTIFALKKNVQKYYELTNAYNTFYSNQQRTYAYEDAYNTLASYAKLKDTIQRVKTVERFDDIPVEELLSLMRKEINKYKTILLYPNLPTNFQEIISNNTIGSKFNDRSEDRVLFQRFNMHYKIENCMFEEAQSLIFKLKDPHLFRTFLEKLQSIYDYHMQNIIEKEKVEKETAKVFEKEGYNLKNLSDNYVSQVGDVMDQANANPLLQFKLYQLLFKLLSEKHYSIDKYESRVATGIPRLLFLSANKSKNKEEMQQIVISFIKTIIIEYNKLIDFRKNEKAVELIQGVMEIVNTLDAGISQEILTASNYGNKKWVITLLYELSAYKDQLLDVLDENEKMDTFAQPVCDGLRNSSLKYESLLCTEKIAHEQRYELVDNKVNSFKKGIILDENLPCCCCGRVSSKKLIFKCGHCMCNECLDKVVVKGSEYECNDCKIKFNRDLQRSTYMQPTPKKK